MDVPHARAAQDVADALAVDPARGLSGDEAGRRLARGGPNRPPTAPQRPAWRLWLDQFRSLVVALLAAAAAVALVTGERIDAAAIGVVLLLNATVGFLTEWQARQALDALGQQASAQARVRRDAREVVLDAADIVPGDIVLLSAGDRIPADLRLIEAVQLQSDESTLTGESEPVDKSAEPVPAETTLAERTGMLYQGASVATGRAVGIVVATGTGTELGRIGTLLVGAGSETTPLERQMDTLGRQLVVLVLGIATLVFLVGALRQSIAPGERHNLWQLAQTAISLAVAAVPEGLPAVTTLVLALGVMRMARRNALVRRLAAVETLGSATVICSDKTGTLTQNRMTVREWNATARALRVAALCTEARLAGNVAVEDPTETALLRAAVEAGADADALRRDYPRIDERPFSSETRRMITVHRTPEGGRLALYKGAPSALLARCTSFAGPEGEEPLDDMARVRFEEANAAMADRALRVLALAEQPLPDDATSLDDGAIFLTLVGMADPLRPEARDAVSRARAAGLRTILLTGDQPRTAGAIARELGLGDPEAGPAVVHARELAELSDTAALADLARRADAFARVSPEEKLRIVAALQQAGEVVAVTGDGVNDAPALQQADIGVAMGQRGTDVAREAADIVLTDDNFATLVGAIEGGRTIYANILKFVHFLFTGNLTEVLVIFVAVALGWPLPLLPLQILWVNLVTDVFPALALALEPASPHAMRRGPRSPEATILSRALLGRVILESVALAALVLTIYQVATTRYGPGAHARTVALIALVGIQVAQMFNCRSRIRSGLAGLRDNPSLWAALGTVMALQALALHVPAASKLLGTVPPNLVDFAVTPLAVLAPLAWMELVKIFLRRADARG